MKLTKKLESEILKVYYAYWEAYLKGDLKKFASFLDENVTVFGTALGEVFTNKKEAIKFYSATADQMTGKADFRKRRIKLKAAGNTVVVNEQCDLYVLIDGLWIFYDHARITAILEQKGNTWKCVHQHGSFPDNRTEEGDQIATQKIKKENLQLKEAVKRRTIELEEKNRELEIETAMEKVRTVAMGMKRREDMLQICKTISQQMAKLGVKEIRNVQTAIFNVPRGTYMNYEYYAKHNKTFITETLYTNHKVARTFAAKMLKGRGEVSITHIKGKQKVKEWLNYQKGTNVFIDSFLNKATSLTYYWYSLGPVALGISTYFPLTKEEQQLFSRFLKVFELAYRRYLDIEKAEAQAREAQIEAALERIRAASLAMRDSSALSTIIFRLYTELTKLDAKLDRCFIMIVNPENKGITWWMAGQEGLLAENGFFVQMNEHASHLMYLDNCKKRKKKWTYLFEGKEKRDWDRFGFNKTELARLPEPVKAFMSAAKKVYLSGSSDQFGSLVTGSFEPLPEEQQDIISRFATVFNQTYTRFLDLQRAEAQAREAQIEAALERVRSRSLAMHKSEELKEVIRMVLEQFIQLNIKAEHAGFYIDYKAHDDMHIWLADPNLEPFYAVIPYFDTPTWNSFLEAKAKGITLHTDLLDFKAKNKFYRSLFKLFAIPEEAKKFYLQCKGLAVSTVLLDSVGLYIENFDGTPYTDEENNILIRFGKVFQQAYTRFLDLQKAEEQAKEAEIQLALERVRARSLAMHHTSELQEVVNIAAQQLHGIGMDINGGVFIAINTEIDKELSIWASGGMADYIQKVTVPELNKPIFTTLRDAIKKGNSFLIESFSDKEKRELFTHLFKYEPWKSLPKERKKELLSRKGGFARSVVISHYTSISITNHNGKAFTEDENEILKRFGKVFEQSYIRFLDLQKAEAQAREAQIEAALERVRARAMAMHSSNELNEVVHELRKQMGLLGQKGLETCVIHLHDESPDFIHSWAAIKPPETESEILESRISVPKKGLLIIEEAMKAYDSNRQDYIIMNEGKKRKQWFSFLEKESPESYNTLMESANGNIENLRAFWSFADFPGGSLLMVTMKDPNDLTRNLLRRFANVFGLAYRRFADLKKAEAQTREAQIEAALERVRAAAMSMHRSEELLNVCEVLYKEVGALGFSTLRNAMINIHNDEKKSFINYDYSDEIGRSTNHLYYNIHPLVEKQIGTIRSADDAFSETYFTGRDLTTWKNFRKRIGEKNDPRLDKNKGLYYYFYSIGIGSIGISTFGPISEEKKALLKRFRNVFALSYQRYIDIAKAEVQAREAQIELGLERVRARAMAMQKSDELSELVDTVFKELTKLDFALNWCIINIIDAPSLTNMVWAANPETSKPPESYLMKFEDYPFHHSMMKGYQERKTKHVYVLDGKEKKTYDDYLFNKTEWRRVPKAAQAASRAMKRYVATFTFSNFGGLQTVGEEYLSEENLDILSRFGKVFDLTYTRFNDLQKAEAQAREAKIETALEKVRSRTMAMHKSEELREVIQVVYKQLVDLQLPVEHAGFILDYKEEDDMHIWFASKQVSPTEIRIPYFDSPHWNSFKETKAHGKSFFVNKLNFEEKNKFYKDLFKWIPPLPDEAVQSIFSRPGLIISTVLLENVGLYIENYSEKPFTEEENTLLIRFGKVFQQTYTRFLDLQKAEAQTREAQIETALEKVRSRTMAMQSSNELQETAAVLFQEFKKLGTEEMLQVTIGIYNEEDRVIDFRVTSWSGGGEQENRSFQLDMDEPTLVKHAIAAWKAGKKSAVFDLTGKALQGWLNYRNKISGLNINMNDTGGRRVITAAYFSKGHLTISSLNPLQQETIKTLERFAAVFDGTYTRFLDLERAEAQALRAEQDLIAIKEAKQKAEDALTELQVTQKQLIQSEKMASLGELTAGIAHEIQNPLNFVNNFSEVSKELLDEMKEAIEKGDTEDAKEIMNDVIQNLEKINHHGKRADSIVKGMLQHSRSSTGQKELTDINGLCDEYLRLAYHGLRAKDKSFNAKFETQFDETVGNLNLIPQDIGRVVLNLINNAFYAVSERKKLNQPGYEPTVSVSTNKNGNKVVIGVKDNGTGIPQKVLDKIFQPFFTTKPTGLGTGLGLSLSYDIITKGHGGELKVETKEGEGTEFFILLPL